MSTEKHVELKIAQKEKELLELREQLEIAKLQLPEYKIAEELHSLMCTWNHTDGCGWYYEIHKNQTDWNGHAHGEYLKKALKLVHKCKAENTDPEIVLDLYRTVKAL